jgi:hypothetical protein
LNEETFTKLLSQALEAAGSRSSGLLHRNTIFEAISEAIPTLTQKQMQGLVSLAVIEDDGFASYEPIVSNGFKVLQYIQEQDMLQSW